MGGTLDSSEFGKALREFYRRVDLEIIREGKVLYLPYGFGSIFLKKRKAQTVLNDDFGVESTTVPVDWVLTWQLWKKDEDAKNNNIKIYMDNRHSNDDVYRIHWSKNNAVVAGLGVYKYVGTRKMRRGLAKTIKSSGGIKV
jgi:hypothetical protein